jgi:hypothetical protein
MNGYFYGIAVMIVGAVLFLISRRRPRRPSIHADRGSVAIGGSNNGNIMNVNSGASAGHGPSGHWLTLISIFVEVAGIAAVIWHATHLAGK